MDIMCRMPPFFVSHVFHVYFSHGLLVYLSTCISGEYQVKFGPYFFSHVIHIAFLMWIVGVHFQVYYL